MKRIISSMAAGAIALSSTPALAAENYYECQSKTNTVEKAACIRLYKRSTALKKGTDVRQKVIESVDLLRQVRINRRSDLQDRRVGGSDRASNADTLVQRRQEALAERNQRIQARRTRKLAQAKERQALLQSYVRTQAKTSARNNALGQSSLRRRSEDMQSKTQQRRNALKRAQAQCTTERGTMDYQACLSKKRAALLK